MKFPVRKSLFNSHFCARLGLEVCTLFGATALAQSSSLTETQLAAQTTQSPPSYSVTDLGPSFTSPAALNDLGQVVGFGSTADFNLHPFLWQDGKITDLGTLGGPQARAMGINNQGQVVGFSDRGLGPEDNHAFLWQHGRMMDLGTLGGTASSAAAINDKGQVVGWSDIPGGPPGQAPLVHAFLWQNGRMVDLGTLGGDNAYAFAINNQGLVVGSSATANGRLDAFLWRDGHMTNIIGAPGLAIWAEGINQGGQVAGFTTTDVEDEHAFVWQNGQMTKLGPGFAQGINDKGQVIGLVVTQGALWQGGKFFALNTLIPPASGWDLGVATGINKLGQIVGMGTFNGKSHGYLLTPAHAVDATLQLSLPSWQFAAHAVGQTSGPATIWIYNSGPAAADFNTIKFTGADPHDFSITGDTCGSTLAPFTTCKVVFHFIPIAVGERTASLALNDNAKDGPHTIPVQGFGSSK